MSARDRSKRVMQQKTPYTEPIHKRLSGILRTFRETLPPLLFVLGVCYVWHIGAVSPLIKNSVLTVFGGGVLLLLGQFFQKAVMEPFQEMQKTIGEVGAALLIYAGSSEIGLRDELQQEAATALRRRAGDLASKRRAMGYYGVFSRMEMMPPDEDIKKTVSDLVLMSNCVGRGKIELFNDASDRIKAALWLDR